MTTNASFYSWRSAIGSKIDRFAALIILLTILIPFVPLFAAWWQVDPELWAHLWKTQLVDLLSNTLLLALFVGLGSFILGVGLAWLVVIYEFRGRKILQWGLMLPLAIPPYILAFVLLGFVDFQGPLESLLLSLGIRWLPEVRNTFGVAIVFILSLYPYVYLLMRAALLKNGRNDYESALCLGYSKIAAFWKLIIPLTRPAWIAGLALVLMETLADFGAVSIFSYDTFTTAIYKSWFGFFSPATAAQLASILLLFVALAIFSEKWGRGKSRFVQAGIKLNQHRQGLRGWKGWLAQSIAWTIFSLGFLLPLIQLVYWVSKTSNKASSSVSDLLGHTITLAIVAALLTLLVAAIIVWAQKNSQQRAANNSLSSKRESWWQLGFETSLIGYALPGTVLAVGIMLGLNLIDQGYNQLTGHKGQWLAGTLVAMLIAYVIRFLRIAHGPLANSMAQIKPSIIEASMSLGASKFERLTRVYIPLLRPGVLTAVLLVFVEVMKEMPATLLLRPFGWDTLAVRIYELTSEGEWQLAALPALLLVVIGIAPVIYLIKKSES